jgi:hypothetical protein
MWDVSEGVMMANAHAGVRGASARFGSSAQGSPSRARSEKRCDGQNSQKSNGDAHVFF